MLYWTGKETKPERTTSQQKNAKLDVESDVEEIPETVFEQEQVDPIELHFNIEGTNGGTNDKDGSNGGMNGKQSEYPFNIYDLLKKQQDKDKEAVLSEDVLKYRSGFTPNEHTDVSSNSVGSESGEVNKESKHDKKYDLDPATNFFNETSILKEDVETFTCRGHFSKSEIPRGSIIQVMEDLIKIGQVMGYKMEGCSRNIEEIIQLRGENENVDVNDIKLCWGNCLFEFVCGPLVGNSGGILCVWDPRVFRKLNATISDYFIAIQGLWVFSDKRLMIIALYAAQEVSEKRMLWEYLNYVIDNWNGEVIIMEDFNKVRSREERYGTTFNKWGADVFNSFIYLGGLLDVPLEGCSFTWVHKSASKMSKLDRCLISDDLIEASPNICAISLDQYLSNHRPILLRFDSFVEEVWKEQGYSDVNAFDAFMMKLRTFKAKIRIWIKDGKEKSSIEKTKLKGMLTDLDLVIDKREANSDILNKRLHILKDIQLTEKLNTLEVAQKSKIKWAIEDQRDELESSISKEEFKNVVWDCGLDKSPGPDGFTFGFFVDIGTCWRVLYLMRSSHSSTWLDIIQDFQQLKSKGMNLFSFFKKRIGNGEKSSFWEEVSKGGDTLKSMFPRFYALELSKNISVANKLAQVDMVGSFRRPPRGGVELQQYTCFRSILEDVILLNSQDRWLWSLTCSGGFSVASVRRFIDDYMLPDVSFKTKWLKVVPIKINIHAWKVKLDGLPTRFNLSRRGIDINSINCTCCAIAVESTSRLFFTCFMVRELHRKIAIWWDIKLIEVDSFEGWTVWMSDILLHGFCKEILASNLEPTGLAQLATKAALGEMRRFEDGKDYLLGLLLSYEMEEYRVVVGLVLSYEMEGYRVMVGWLEGLARKPKLYAILAKKFMETDVFIFATVVTLQSLDVDIKLCIHAIGRWPPPPQSPYHRHHHSKPPSSPSKRRVRVELGLVDEQKNQRSGLEPRTKLEPIRTEPELVLEFEIFAINPVPTEFTIHGLWPEPNGAPSTEIFDAQELATLATELCKYWPNLESKQQQIAFNIDFWKKEWFKHGQYSGLGVREYFEKSLELHKDAGRALRAKLAAEKITPNIYNPYKLVDVQAAVNKSNGGFSGTIICVQRQGSGNKQQIQEIRFSYTNNFQKQNSSPSRCVPEILFPAPESR
nr:RNA-directed DNA polymerase, eukaryota [Tanacetum cinerariifolium]GEW05149.1 RNA-directed DNA polymerase, eukaryota [Tanacetum cinerariifolium]